MSALTWCCCDRRIPLGPRARVMGILNVTPDSFSDGGRFTSSLEAVQAGLRMVEEGADFLDVGGESTRPGATEVPVEEELARVIPVIEALVGQTEIPISIDTRHAPVAAAALHAGAVIVNDVSAMTHDPQMTVVVAEAGAGVVLMHSRGEPATMQDRPHYDDVVREVRAHLAGRMQAAIGAGVEQERIVLDPGIGFGKTVEHNCALLAGISRLAELGRPVLVGLSRKSFLGAITGREVGDRRAAGLAAHAFVMAQGVSILRVHDVMDTCDAASIVDMLMRNRHA